MVVKINIRRCCSMKRYFGCDAHKKYSMFASINDAGHRESCIRVGNDRYQFSCFLHTLPPGSPIAVETVGNWYWMVDEMEKAGHEPKLTNAGKAKLMMGQINKTDKLDANGLALLLRNGTLPTVWIPPGELRDQRELPRMRMAIVRVRTMLKNRIHASLAKYAIQITEVSDIFGVSGRTLMKKRLSELPPHTQCSVEAQLKLLEQVEEHIKLCEEQIEEVVEKTPAMMLLMTLPGVGPILAVVIALEIGQVARFPTAQKLACYGGTVPRIKDSGGRIRFGRVRPDVNRYLKWALIEAANVVVLNQTRWPNRHVVRLYRRIMQRRGHAKAVVAVARHLAEAAFWMLKKNGPYKEPKNNEPVPSTQK
jgi:transposase